MLTGLFIEHHINVHIVGMEQKYVGLWELLFHFQL